MFPLSVMGSKAENHSCYIYSHMSNFSDFLPELLIMHEFGHMPIETMESELTHNGL
jgi:hypothetical protein